MIIEEVTAPRSLPKSAIRPRLALADNFCYRHPTGLKLCMYTLSYHTFQISPRTQLCLHRFMTYPCPTPASPCAAPPILPRFQTSKSAYISNRPLATFWGVAPHTVSVLNLELWADTCSKRDLFMNSSCPSHVPAAASPGCVNYPIIYRNLKFQLNPSTPWSPTPCRPVQVTHSTGAPVSDKVYVDVPHRETRPVACPSTHR